MSEQHDDNAKEAPVANSTSFALAVNNDEAGTSGTGSIELTSDGGVE